jgi:hypothetical protein
MLVHLLTPWDGRGKFHRPIHKPSWVLRGTSGSPSPSASSAQAFLGPEWSTQR